MKILYIRAIFTIPAVVLISFFATTVFADEFGRSETGEAAETLDRRSAAQEKKAEDVAAPGTGADGESYDFAYDENVFDLDPEAKKSLIKRIQWRLLFWTSMNYFNNADLRKLDNSNETSVDNTDDRTMFGVSGVELDAFFPIHPRLDFRVDVWRTGFWGHDQLGGRDTNNDLKLTRNGANTVNFGLMHLDIHLKKEPTRASRADIRFGRQYYTIGGRIDKDFLLDDILDAVVFRWYGKFGRMDAIIIDVYNNATNTQNANFVQYISYDAEKVKHFNGDVNTARSGLLYRFPIIGDADLGGTHLEARAFAYVAKFGGVNVAGVSNGGADRTNNGTSGNFTDNDFSGMRGVKVNAGYRSWLRTALTVSQSYGIDRKKLSVTYLPQDVDNNGKAYMGEVELSFFNRRILLLGSYFYAQGGRYYADGSQFSHGFVGFKAAHAGGLLTDLYYGIHPTAYTSSSGIYDTPYDRDRKSGTEVKHVGVALGILRNFYLKFDWWRLVDTNRVVLYDTGSPGLGGIFNNKDRGNTISQNILLMVAAPIYPNQNTVMQAARRFGAPMGEEYDFGAEWEAIPNWKIWMTYGVFVPMRYYSTPGLVQGTPQGSTRFVGFQLGTKLIF